MAVIADVTHFMPGLSSRLAIWIVASVKPALGKTNAHQDRLKDILRTPRKIATVDRLKYQKANSQMKMPVVPPTSLMTSPADIEVTPMKLVGKISVALLPRRTRAWTV